MLTVKERLELDELEKMNKDFSKSDNKELEDNYVYDNRLGSIITFSFILWNRSFYSL